MRLTPPRQKITFLTNEEEHPGEFTGVYDNHRRPVYQFDDGLWVVDYAGSMGWVRWPHTAD